MPDKPLSKARNKFELVLSDGRLRSTIDIPVSWTVSGALAALAALAYRIWISH
jgi:hypothetical protein